MRLAVPAPGRRAGVRRRREGDAAGRAVAVAERGGRALGDDAPARDHRDPVREPLGLLEVVRGEDDRLAELAQPLDHLPSGAPRRRVEAGGRLVQEHELGVADECEGDVDAALLAARQPAAAAVAHLGQARQPQHLVERQRPLVVARVELDDLGHGQLGLDARLLQDDAEPPAPGRARRLRVLAQDADLAGGPRAEPLQVLDRGRLAGAVGAEHREHLAGAHGEVDAVDGHDVAVGDAQAADLDRRIGRHPFSPGPRGRPVPRRDVDQRGVRLVLDLQRGVADVEALASRACSSRRAAWQSAPDGTMTWAASAGKPDVTSHTCRSWTSTHGRVGGERLADRAAGRGRAAPPPAAPGRSRAAAARRSAASARRPTAPRSGRRGRSPWRARRGRRSMAPTEPNRSASTCMRAPSTLRLRRSARASDQAAATLTSAPSTPTTTTTPPSTSGGSDRRADGVDGDHEREGQQRGAVDLRRQDLRPLAARR